MATTNNETVNWTLPDITNRTKLNVRTNTTSNTSINLKDLLTVKVNGYFILCDNVVSAMLRQYMLFFVFA